MQIGRVDVAVDHDRPFAGHRPKRRRDGRLARAPLAAEDDDLLDDDDLLTDDDLLGDEDLLGDGDLLGGDEEIWQEDDEIFDLDEDEVRVGAGDDVILEPA